MNQEKIPTENSEKLESWNKISEEVEKITDKIGYKVDDGIKEAVIACTDMFRALFIVKAPMRGAPIFPPKEISPAPAVKERSNTPATAFDRVKLPPFELSRTSLVSVMEEAKERNERKEIGRKKRKRRKR